MSQIRTRVRLFLALVYALGVACVVAGMYPWHGSDAVQFGCYLILTALASGLKVILPGFEATVSVNFIFFLLAISNLTLSESLALGVTAVFVQCYWNATKRMRLIHFAFNLSQVLLAITAAYWTFAYLTQHLLHGKALIALLASTIVYFVFNTLPVATVVSLSEGKSVLPKWTGTYTWTFAYYLIGASIAGVIQLLNHLAGWELSILVLPAMYAIFYSYRLYVGKLEESNKHLEEMASIHMRTIEALALAIEAKDHTTGDHLQRVRVYALELAKDLGLTPAETDALRAAAVLHDIGKLAVPEHIISKPGKLTPEEFEKMKVHPIVGSEILDQVRFPYPVVPIVRSHHEKWDGSGYPDGLAGESIPIGARILAAVDCLDALASDRQYRRALPLHEAMAKVEADAGRSFDPRVVAALKARYIELEQLARTQEPEEKPKLSVDVKVERGAAPAAGFAESEGTKKRDVVPGRRQTDKAAAALPDFIATQQDGMATADEAFTAIAMKLRHSIAFDAVAIFAVEEENLVPRFSLGECHRVLMSVRIKSGHGLVGWVAETHNSILNGNPSVDSGFENGATPFLSALAVPLEAGSKLVGVLALYHREAGIFNSRDLEVLNASRSELAEWASKQVQAQALRSTQSPSFIPARLESAIEMIGAD